MARRLHLGWGFFNSFQAQTNGNPDVFGFRFGMLICLAAVSFEY
jgi:hypothetical protein